MRETIIRVLALFGTAFIGLITSVIVPYAVEDFKEKRKRKCKYCGKPYGFFDNYCRKCGKPLWEQIRGEQE